jgi:protein MpaA
MTFCPARSKKPLPTRATYNPCMHFRTLCIAVLAINSVASYAIPMRSCNDYSAKIPNVKPALCEAAQLQDSKARSVLGRPIWSRDIPATGVPLRVLVLGGIHGDEMSSSSLVFHWIAMAQTPPSDTPVPISWRFIPTLNPDGMFAKPARRVNARGVDLNRNFPTPNWARDARHYWEERTRRDPRRWPGTQPLSEPESRFLLEQMDSFKPNLIVSVHAPYGVLDFDGPSVPPSRLGRLYLDQVGIFPGSLGNYGGIHKGVPVVTIELPSASRTPQDAEMRQMWMDLLRWTTERLGSTASSGPSATPATTTASPDLPKSP